MSACFWNRFLRIDLTGRRVEEFSLDPALFRKFLGGSGLAAYLLEKDLDPQMDPLDPESPLAVFTGLLSGTPAPSSMRASFCARSLLTGIWAEANVGGKFGLGLKGSGYDGIIITGRSKEPVVLGVSQEGVEFIDGSGLWGLDTYETEESVKNLRPDSRVACIGPAGEKLVRIAGIMTDGKLGRAAGRCGLGALMGSKNLKAIAASGGKKTDVYNKSRLMELVRESIPVIKEKAAGLTRFGTAGGVMAVEANGDLPIRNWTLGEWAEGAAKTCGQEIDRLYLAKHSSCPGCPIRCAKLVKIPSGPFAGDVVNGPQFETCAGFGSLLLNDDLETILLANDLCNRLGLDTISAAAVTALAMECFEAGLINPSDTGGIHLNWGSREAVLEVLNMTANRRGLGNILAEGTVRAAGEIGGLAPEFVVATKGLDLAFHDPRAFTGMAVSNATAVRGGCHLEGLTFFVESGGFPGILVGFDRDIHPHGTEYKSELAVLMQNFLSTFNPLGLCKFLMRGGMGPETLSNWLTASTGWNVDMNELMETGERIFNLKRMYNFRLGISRKDDRLPLRLETHDRKTGRAAGSLPHMGRMLADYYQLRGWSPEGVPKPDTLKRLGLL
ncbi:MAG: aldehyde ferredoxin oxidoreductase family protein [Desulfocucumaceae bacterium]